MVIEINNFNSLKKPLSKLSAESPPLFGIMTAQHMLEHLLATILISYGKLQTKLFNPADKAAKAKQLLIYSEIDFPKGMKAPMIGDELPALRFPSIEIVKDKLAFEIAQFESYYRENARATQLHPVLGELNYEEWIIFHNKHFTHHFIQFNLL